MNERIRELAHEAGLLTYNPKGVPTKLEKFAELIVKECANICFSEAEGHSMVFGAHSVGTKFGKHCGVVIKEHFGVRE